jgi:hypothetical protein
MDGNIIETVAAEGAIRLVVVATIVVSVEWVNDRLNRDDTTKVNGGGDSNDRE